MRQRPGGTTSAYNTEERYVRMLTQDVVRRLSNCNVISTVKQEEDENEWLSVRTKGIGGSDVGAICGVSPFSTALQVYFKKTGQYADTFSANEEAKDRMHFGHMLEPVVANEYALRTGNRLIDINCTVSHKDHPWAVANIDRLIVDEEGNPVGILECKTTSEYMKDEWDSGEILESYIYQLNWYLWILGLEHGAFACLVGGNKFYCYDVHRNDELLESTIIPNAREFWFENVLKLQTPEIQAGDDEVVKALYADCVKGATIQLTEETDNDLVATIVSCKAKIKELEEIQKTAENKIKDKIGENEIAHTLDYVVKWSPQQQKRVDTTLLKGQFPEVYEAVAKTINFRVMRIKGGVE